MSPATLEARSGARRRLVAGIVLVAVCWPLNWGLDGVRTHVLFFPLWLGYVLVADGLALLRTGTSISARSPRRFALLFLLSVPGWWLFELVNERLRNWEYVGGDFGDVEYFVLSSIAFSTVVPAVLATAEAVRGTGLVRRLARGPRISPSRRLERALLATGVATGAAMLVWPQVLYPFVWVSGVLVLEPVCRWLGRRSLLDELGRGDWRTFASLWAGVLVCGFFWEMWNYWSWPKWVYHVPGVGFAKVFEMPALGYLGYLPFSLEVYLLKQIVLPEEPSPDERVDTEPASSVTLEDR